MDRRKLEQSTVTIAITLLFLMTVGLILLIADQFWMWDIFPPNIEQVLGFMMAAFGIVIFSSVLVNIMLNLSIIALNSDELIKNKLGELQHKNERPKK